MGDAAAPVSEFFTSTGHAPLDNPDILVLLHVGLGRRCTGNTARFIRDIEDD